MFLSAIKNSLNLGNLTPAWHKCTVCEMVICFILLPDPQKWPFALVALVLCIIQLSVFNADDLETEQNIEYYFTFKTRSVGKESQCVSLSSKVGISPWKIRESSRTPSSQFNTAATLSTKWKLCVTPFINHSVCFLLLSHPQYFTASTCTYAVFMKCAVMHGRWLTNGKNKRVHPAFPTYHWNAVNSNVTSSVAQISEGYGAHVG